MKIVGHVINEAWPEVNGLNCGERSGVKQKVRREFCGEGWCQQRGESCLYSQLLSASRNWTRKIWTTMQQELLTAADEVSEVFRTCSLQVQWRVVPSVGCSAVLVA